MKRYKRAGEAGLQRLAELSQRIGLETSTSVRAFRR